MSTISLFTTIQYQDPTGFQKMVNQIESLGCFKSRQIVVVTDKEGVKKGIETRVDQPLWKTAAKIATVFLLVLPLIVLVVVRVVHRMYLDIPVCTEQQKPEEIEKAKALQKQQEEEMRIQQEELAEKKAIESAQQLVKDAKKEIDLLIETNFSTSEMFSRELKSYIDRYSQYPNILPGLNNELFVLLVEKRNIVKLCDKDEIYPIVLSYLNREQLRGLFTYLWDFIPCEFHAISIEEMEEKLKRNIRLWVVEYTRCLLDGSEAKQVCIEVYKEILNDCVSPYIYWEVKACYKYAFELLRQYLKEQFKIETSVVQEENVINKLFYLLTSDNLLHRDKSGQILDAIFRLYEDESASAEDRGKILEKIKEEGSLLDRVYFLNDFLKIVDFLSKNKCEFSKDYQKAVISRILSQCTPKPNSTEWIYPIDTESLEKLLGLLDKDEDLKRAILPQLKELDSSLPQSFSWILSSFLKANETPLTYEFLN